MRSSLMCVVVASGWLAMTALVFAQGGPTSPARRIPEAVGIKNPNPPTADSVPSGKKLFIFFCASCHGPGGKGDGGVYGAFGGGSPTNLTEDEFQSVMTDGEIFWAIRNGIGLVEMAGFSKRITDPQIWDIVNFIRSIAEKPRSSR